MLDSGRGPAHKSSEMGSQPHARLLDGERVLWEGRPASGVILRPIDLLLVPFSLAWGGFAAFWNVTVWSTDAPLAFKLFGLPFLAIGIYVTIGRFWFDARTRDGLRYYITNRRVLISRRGGLSIESLDISRLPTIKLEERPDGSGTITFGSSPGVFGPANGFGIWQQSLDPRPTFLRIPDVRQAYQVIQMQANA